MAGVAGLALDDLLRRAGGEDAPAAVAAFGPEIDDPVGGLDDIQVVFDDDNGVAVVQTFAETGR